MRQATHLLVVLLIIGSAATSGVVFVGSTSAAAPTLETNTGVQVAEGSDDTQISAADLNSSDLNGDTITYNLTTAVSNGTLFLDGTEGGSEDGMRDGEQPVGTGTFTQADVDAGRLYYSHDGSESTSDYFEFDVTDGNGSTVSGNTFEIDVTAVDDPPALTTNSAGTNYTAGEVVVDDSLTVTDSDGGTIDGATVAIDSGLDADVDTLAVDDSIASNNNITGTKYDNATGVLTLDGTASAAEMQTVLRTVTYTYSGETTASARELNVSFALGTGSNNTSPQTTAQVIVTVGTNTAAPRTTIDQPVEGATLTTSDVAFDASANKSGNWTYSVDGRANQTATGANGTQTLNMTLSGLADGSHTVTVYIEDESRTVGTDRVNFSIATTPPNLVHNGGFENSSNDFDLDENYNTLVADSPAITGWHVSSGEVDQVGSYWTPQDGSVSIDLSGSEPGVIEQDITGLEAGKHYELTYYYAGHRVDGGSYDAGVEIADLNITETTDTTDWTLATHTFTADSTAETLTFTQITPSSGAQGMAIDNVSIVRSPDPIDTAAPNVSIDQPAGGAALTTSDVALSASANETGNWTYSVDGGPNQTATGANGTQTLNVTLSGLADGSHTATVSIEDDGGNVDSDTVSFTVSTASSLTTSSSKTEYTASNGGFVVDDSLTVTGPDGELINGATVAIGSGFDASEDTLAVNSTAVSDAGLTSSYDPSTGVLTLTGTASADEMQTVLRTVTYTYSGDATASARDLDVSFALGTGGNKVFNPTTGHYYELVEESVTWKTAKRNAETKSHLGLQGYLATLTSQQEDDDIQSQFTTEAWIGASDADTADDWRWVTGPESGTLFWRGKNGGSEQNGEYAGWGSQEPNDATNGGNKENYAEIDGGSNRWVDQINNDPQHYLVEYGGLNGDPPVTSRRTVTVDTEAPTLTTSSGSVSTTTASGAYLVDDELTLTNPDGGTIDNVTVSLGDFDPSSDDLSVNTTLATNRGITSTYDDTTGVMTLSADSQATSADDFQAVLRTVTYRFTGASTADGTDRTVPIRFTLNANQQQVTAYDGHYYEYVSDSVSFDTARSEAENRSHLGLDDAHERARRRCDSPAVRSGGLDRRIRRRDRG